MLAFPRGGATVENFDAQVRTNICSRASIHQTLNSRILFSLDL